MKANDYQDLLIWQKGMDVVVLTYGLIKRLPLEERFALADQMRRSAVSIPSNIAEGHARVAPKDFARFLSIACGSVSELETQFLIAERLAYFKGSDLINVRQELEAMKKMIKSLVFRLLNQSYKP